MEAARRGLTIPDLRADRPLSFRDFVDGVYPRYRWYRHCVVLADVLQRVADGEIKRLMIFMPPRHGKSLLASRLFSAYWLYRYPDQWVGVNSYGADLAFTLSRSARENFAAAGGEISDASSAVNHWETPAGGGMWAAGVGGPISGKGFNCGIIDDPVKNAEDAASEVVREKQKEWYSSTFYTREEPNADGDPDGAIVIIQCMTGDTRVLMATGDEKPLRDIRLGDRVATYESGKVSVSTVRNWINNGPDLVYEIRMKSGIIAKANARHPFLVEEGGKTKWQRTATLKKGNVILKVIGANGRASHATKKDATSQPNAKACVNRTITSIDGNLAFGHLRSILGLGVKRICATAMGLASRNMSAFWPSKAAFVPSVGVLPRKRTPAHIGTASSASIIATIAKRLGGFSATTATLPSVMERPRKFFSPPLSTYEITRDAVVEVVEGGVEDVFDVEIERTENFIANGLVSHNTRWHEDDLSGWLLSKEGDEEGDAERWHIVSFDAIHEEEPPEFPATCTVEPDWRESGEALCPERRPLSKLERIRRAVSPYFWGALFQQRPVPRTGGMFSPAWPIVGAIPVGCTFVRYWDKAGTAGGGAYSAGVLMAKAPDGSYYITHVERGQWSAAEREAVINATAAMDGKGVAIWVEQEPGSGGLESADNTVIHLSGYVVHKDRVTGDKVTRAGPLSAQAEVGNVRLVEGPWNRDFVDEAKLFPHGKYKDQVDAAAGAFNKLALAPPPRRMVAGANPLRGYRG